MAKIVEMSTKKQEETDITFQDWYNNEPEEVRELLDELGIKDFEGVEKMATLLGIDIRKMDRFYETHESDELPTMEDVMFDDDDPAGDAHRMLMNSSEGACEDGDDDDFDDDDFDDFDGFEDSLSALPEDIFVTGVPVEEYHLRLKLNNSPLPIWREVLVPSNISLEFLAFVIIEVMGWKNEHLHHFKYKDIIYKNRSSIEMENEMFSFISRRFKTCVSEDIPVADVFRLKGERILFEYDFGDSWQHDVWQKGIRAYASGEKPCIRVLKGTGSCPPENCGGVWGYAGLLDIHSKKRKSAEEKERLDWYDLDRFFRPEDFDIEYAQERLDCLWGNATEE